MKLYSLAFFSVAAFGVLLYLTMKNKADVAKLSNAYIEANT